jgi:hypothetical protein
MPVRSFFSALCLKYYGPFFRSAFICRAIASTKVIGQGYILDLDVRNLDTPGFSCCIDNM